MPESNLAKIAVTFAVQHLPHSEAELTGEVPFDTLAPYRAEALTHLKEHIELPGFRKGHVPEDMLVKKVGEIGVLEEAIEHLMRDLYPALILEKKLDPIGRPTIAITKLAPGNPVGLTVRTALFPKFELPEYKKIAGGITKEAVKDPTEEEITQAIDQVRAAHATLKDAEGKPILPDVTDEWAKGLGEFTNVADFKAKLVEHMKREKEQSVKEKHRIAVTEAIMGKTTIDIPTIFVESELDKMVGQMKEDVKRFGLQFEDYLKRSNKTEEDIRKDFRTDAEKRAKLQLILNAIAEKENIQIPAADIDAEAKHILDHFKDADRERVHIYVESVLRNEKVLSMLESLT